jgi:ligand-binding sensor domain-containing protein/signal transduction histidine kinase
MAPDRNQSILDRMSGVAGNAHLDRYTAAENQFSIGSFLYGLCMVTTRTAGLARASCVGLALIFACHSLHGLGASESQYARSLWKVQDGLPEGTVQALAETQDGYLWIGTTGGLTRFDGTHFVLNGSSTLPIPVVNSIFCLLSAKDGSLWIGTEGGGLIHLTRNSVTAYSTPQGLTDGFVRSILEDSRGTVWVGTDNGLFQVNGNSVKRAEVDGLGPLAVHGIAEDRDGRIWVGGSRLLAIEGGRVHSYNLPGTYSSNRVKTILQTSDGVVWVGTVGGLERLVNGTFQRVPGLDGTVRALKQTADGTLWIGTIGNGLWTYKDGVFSHLNGLLPSSTVLQIFEDDSHQVWIGLQDGLVRLSKTPVRVVSLPGGQDADFETISGNGDGDVWVVASGVYRIHDGVARPFRFNELPNEMVRNVFRARQGDLWIGTDGSGVYRITSHGTVHYSAPRDLTNNFIRVFLETRHGDIWIGTDEGVSRIATQGVQKYGIKDGLAYFSTRSILEDRNGDIWIGTDQGLSHWHRNAFLHDAATEALQHEKIWSIFEDAMGILWFGTRDHGLFRLKDGQLAQFTTLQGLVSNSIYQILEDPQRRLWLSGPNTISSLDEQQLLQSSATAKEHLSVSVYAMPYGAEGAQMYGGRQPSGYLDPKGGVWFPSNKGAAHIALEAQSIPSPPRIAIENVTLDGRDLSLLNTIEVPSHMTRLEFSFAPLSLRSQTGIRYRYKLENFDKEWLFAGTNLTASYTNLPAGTYRFRVNAYDVGNPAVISEASIDVQKDPLLWQTWWFVSISVGVLSLFAWAIYQTRMHQIKLRFRAVLDERGRLAREMHDTVIQGCTSISALLEAMASFQTRSHLQGEDLLQYARAQVRATIDEARHAVWDLRHEDEAALDLKASLEAISVQTRKEFPVEVVCTVSGSPLFIPGSTTRELLMVVREAVYNAVLHGHPREVRIEVLFNAQQMSIAVADDGIGFDSNEAQAEGHFGITGMRERMERVGGKMKLTSVSGAGTRIDLSLDRSVLSSRARKGQKPGVNWDAIK